jgi:hypothetical protein
MISNGGRHYVTTIQAILAQRVRLELLQAHAAPAY